MREIPGQPSMIYIDRHLIHEGTSPQAFAGLKAAGRKVRRPELTFAVMDHSVSTKEPPAAGARRRCRRPIRSPRAQLRRVRRPPFRHAQQEPRHRAHHRTRARHHAAGPNDRLRRQPHLDSRRFRRPRFRHRHQRNRARARHAVPLAIQIEDDGNSLHRQETARRHLQRHDSRRDRQNGHRRRKRKRCRVHRRISARPFDGSAHDDVQHDDRRRRPRRNGGAR